jgi:hypothetical protein
MSKVQCQDLQTDFGLWTLDFGPLLLEAMKGVEPLSFGLQDRRSVIQLSYIAEEQRSEVGDQRSDCLFLTSVF